LTSAIGSAGSAYLMPGQIELQLANQKLELSQAFRDRMAALFPGDPLPDIFTPPEQIKSSQAVLPLEVRVHFGDILGPSDDARMAVVATAPLTRDENWVKAAPGTLWVFSRGELLRVFEPSPDYHAPSSEAPPWRAA
jgi:hypothetical protein